VDAPASSGDLVDGRYELMHPLRQGRFGAVWSAELQATGQPVLVKLLKRADDDTDSGWAEKVGRFEREIAQTARLAHPNIPRLLDQGEQAHLGRYAVVEHTGGASLREVLDRGDAQARDVGEATRIMGHVLHALHAAHTLGVVHRDVRPETIRVASGRATLEDFGVAGLLVEARTSSYQPLTGDGQVLGEVAYTPPERFSGGTLDARSDLYSWGLVFCEMLTGTPMVAGAPLEMVSQHQSGAAHTLPAEVPTWLRPVLERCIAKAPEARFASAAEALEMLDGVVARRDAPNTPTRRKASRWRWLLLAGSLVSVAGVAALAGSSGPAQAPPFMPPPPPTHVATTTAASEEDVRTPPETVADPPRAASPQASGKGPATPVGSSLAPRQAVAATPTPAAPTAATPPRPKPKPPATPLDPCRLRPGAQTFPAAAWQPDKAGLTIVLPNDDFDAALESGPRDYRRTFSASLVLRDRGGVYAGGPYRGAMRSARFDWEGHSGKTLAAMTGAAAPDGSSLEVTVIELHRHRVCLRMALAGPFKLQRVVVAPIVARDVARTRFDSRHHGFKGLEILKHFRKTGRRIVPRADGLGTVCPDAPGAIVQGFGLTHEARVSTAKLRPAGAEAFLLELAVPNAGGAVTPLASRFPKRFVGSGPHSVQDHWLAGKSPRTMRSYLTLHPTKSGFCGLLSLVDPAGGARYVWLNLPSAGGPQAP